MSYHKVRWSIELEEVFETESKQDAILEAENLDCQHDGDYIIDSFEIISIEKLKGD